MGDLIGIQQGEGVKDTLRKAAHTGLNVGEKVATKLEPVAVDVFAKVAGKQIRKRVGGSVKKGHALSSVEIKDALQGTPEFKGVHAKDTLPKLGNKSCYIINLQGANEGDCQGTHWVSLHSGSNHAIYCDSFGLPPPNEVEAKIGQ